ncbi:MAG: hypothetical protein AB7P20_06240 [Rhizobiaceae bacterium]
MIPLPKNHTHIAWAYQRTGKKHGRLLEVGSGRLDPDRNVAHVVMTRLPIGGFSGYVQLLPHGTKPMPQQVQPEQAADDDEAAAD